MAQNAKPMPQMDQQSTKELNLTVLQRMDKHIEDILTTAGHVTFYEFNMDLGQWSRKDVEGSLFVVKRRTQPRFQFIVMNRRSTANLVEDLLSDFEYEVQVPYLLYRNADQEVNGIWFYNSRECEEVSKLFSRILNAFLKVPPKPKLMSPPSNEFQELESIPTASIVEGPLEPPASTPAVTLPVAEEAFFNNQLSLGPDASSRPLSASPPRPPSVPPMPPPVLPSSAAPASLSLLNPSSMLTSSSIAPILHDSPESASALASASALPPTALVKPSFFMQPPPAITMGLPPPLIPHQPVLQPSHGAPLLQPFPPPAPPLSLAPSTFAQGATPVSREGVRDALSRLLQNDHFIDMIYRELLSTTGSTSK